MTGNSSPPWGKGSQSLKFRVVASRYAPQKMFVVELDGKEIIRAFLNDQDAVEVEAELERLNILEPIKAVVCPQDHQR